MAEGEAAAADLMGSVGSGVIETRHVRRGLVTSLPTDGSEPTSDACVEASARRVVGLHRAADLDATVSAILDPDATIVMPCVQSTHRQVHGSHVRHEGAYSRCCDGWASAQTAEFLRVVPS